MSASSLGTLTLSLIADTGGFISPLDAAERATMKAMGRMGSEVDAFGNKVDETYKKIGLTTKQLDGAFDRIAENLRREAALYKDSSRAAVLKYDLENGALRALSDTQKNYLTKLTRDLAVLDEAAGKSQGSFRGLRGVMQSAGYQAQDVAVQIQQGTSAFQIFSQQGSQFASAFGPSGAVVGALIAVAGIVGGVLFKSFMDTQKAVKDLETNVKSLAKEYGNLSESQRKIVDSGISITISNETEKYKEQTKAISDQVEKIKQLNAEQGKKAFRPEYSGQFGAALTVKEFTIDNTKALAEATKELTANQAEQAVTLQRIRELQDVTGATRAIRETTEEISLMGLRGKALYEATAALKGYDEANTKAFVAVMLLKDANKEANDVKDRIKTLDDETLALQLKNAEIHKNVQLQDELAKKLADAKNTRSDGSRISTPEDQAAVAAAEQRNIKLKEKNDLDQKAVTLYEQQDKAAKDRIRTLQREVDLFGVSSKAQQLEYDIKSGLIKINGGLESKQAQQLLNLTKQLELKEKNLTLDKATEAAAFAGYDNTKGDLESTRMQYELDVGILKVSGELTKEYYDQLIAQKKIEETKNNSKKIDDYLKNQKGDIAKAKLVTGEEKLRYDIMNNILYVQGGINSAKAQELLANQRVLDTQAKQLELTSAIKDGLTNALLDSAMRGEDAFKTLAKSVKGIFSTLVLKPSLDMVTEDLAKSLSGVLGSVGQKDSSGNRVGASGVLGALGPYGAIIGAVGGALIGKWNNLQDAKFEKMTAAYRQGVQATGTVLGDANKKSESIAKAIETLGETASSTLSINYGMYSALQSIDKGINGVAAGFAKTGLGSADYSALGIKQGTQTSGKVTEAVKIIGAIATGGVSLILSELVGGVLGGFVDGVVGSVSKALYNKKTKVIDSGIGIVGTSLADILSEGMVEAFSYADVKTTKKILGVTSSVKVKEVTEALDDVFKRQFADVFIGAGAALEEVSKTFSLSFDPSKLIVDPSKLSLKGLKGDELTSEIEAFFSSTLDNWAGVLVDGTDVLKKYQEIGEGAFETVVRLASQTNVFNEYVSLLNLNFKATGIGAVDLAQQVIEASGSFDQLTNSLSRYYQNFYTEAERSEAATNRLGEEFKKLGYDALPASREEFRKLVEQLDLTNAADQALFASLMSLSDTFAELVPWADEAGTSLEELTNTLKDAASAAFDTLSRSISAEKDRINQIVSNASAAKTELDNALSREKSTLTTAHNERIKQLEEQARTQQELGQQVADAAYEAQRESLKAQQDATKDQIKALESSVSGLSKLFDSLNDAISDMAIVTDEVTRARRRAAEFEIETAITNAKAGRGIPTDGRINDAISILRNNPTELYASLEEMLYATAVTQNKLQDLAGLTETQRSTEELTISLLTSQLSAQELAYDSLEKIKVAADANFEALISMENEKFDKQVANLDAMAEEARKQFDKLSGIDTTLLSLEEAQAKFSAAILAADFENAEAQIKTLELIELNAKNQLSSLQGIETGIMAVEDALRAFTTSVDAALKVQDDSAIRQSNAEYAARNEALLEELKAMREESYNLLQETRKNTQESADSLRRMEEAGMTV